MFWFFACAINENALTKQERMRGKKYEAKICIAHMTRKKSSESAALFDEIGEKFGFSNDL